MRRPARQSERTSDLNTNDEAKKVTAPMSNTKTPTGIDNELVN
jgi:hypothetical protein